MKPINLKQIPSEYIMRTKAGNLWRCGRGYRKNWAKLIGKLVLLHNTPYTLINRIKEAGKWYLVFTDGTNNYTERQDKALHNKHLAKDTVITAVIRHIAGLLPAPKELIDQLLEEANRKAPETYDISDFEYSYTSWKDWRISVGLKCSEFQHKFTFVKAILCNNDRERHTLCRRLSSYYSPDRTSNYPTEYSQIINRVLTNTR